MSRDSVSEINNKNNEINKVKIQHIIYNYIIIYSHPFQSRRISPNDSLLGTPHLVCYLSGDILLDFGG